MIQVRWSAGTFSAANVGGRKSDRAKSARRGPARLEETGRVILERSGMPTWDALRVARNRSRKYYRRIEKGVCVDCCGALDTEYQRCRKCLDRQRLATIAWRQRKAAV